MIPVLSLLVGECAECSALWVAGLAALPPVVCVVLSCCRNCQTAGQATQPDLHTAQGVILQCTSAESLSLHILADQDS